MKTTQTTKPANKQAPKAAPKASSKPANKAKPEGAAKVETKAEGKPAQTQAPKAKTPFAAALYIAAKAGEFGKLAKAYYDRADAYHKKAGTAFPRKRTEADRAEMTKEKAHGIIKRASLGTLAAGAADGQALYDLMRTGADIAK